MSIRESPDPEDPIPYYLDEISKSKAPGTVRSYRTALSHLRTFLDQEGLESNELTDEGCVRLINWLQDDAEQGLAGSTAASVASRISKFYDFYSSRGTFETNPMSLALDRSPIKNDTDPHRRDISIDEMAEFIRGTEDIQTMAMIMTLAKTGIRAGELVNLDFRDLYIDQKRLMAIFPDHRHQLNGKPDTLFIDGNISEEDIINGERRENGNKRNRNTIIPIDNELKKTLLYWCAIRPPSSSDASPLFVLENSMGTPRSIGSRLTINNVLTSVIKRSKQYGWHEQGAGVQNNVTTHYFRHFFSTHLHEATNDRTHVKYLRGDAGSDTIDTYIHNWGNMIENKYRNNIFLFLDG